MRKIKKLLSICLICVMVIAAAVTSIVLIGKNNDNKLDNGIEDSNKLNIPGVYFASADEDTGAADASEDMKGGAIYLGPGSEMVMDRGTMEYHEGYFGGAIYVANGATFTMTGGSIRCNGAMFGGAIYVEDGGTCNINGGEIVYNNAEFAPAIYVESGGRLNVQPEVEALFSKNEFADFGKFYITYYVDGEIEKVTEQKIAAFRLDEAPYTYNECNGYYYDSSLMSNIEEGAVLSYTPDTVTVQGVTADGYQYIDLYTSRATVDDLEFTLMENDKYSVDFINQNAEKLVIPRTYNDKPVSEIVKTNNMVYSAKTLVLNSEIHKIDTADLGGMSSLESIAFPDAVVTIDDEIFNLSATELKLIKIGAGVRSIKSTSFGPVHQDCVVIVSEDNFFYDSRDNCNAVIDSQSNSIIIGMTTSTIPSTVESIASNSFFFSNKTEVTIPSNVKTVGDNAFGGLISSLTIEEGVLSIGERAFNVDINTLVLPSSLQLSSFYTIYGYAKELTVKNASVWSYGLFDLQGVEKITIDTEDCQSVGTILGTYWQKITDIVLTDNVKTISECMLTETELVTEIVVPDSVTSIVDYAFSSNSLKKLTIGNGITAITNNTLANIEGFNADIEELVIGTGVKDLNAGSLNKLTNLKKLEFNSNINGSFIPQMVTSLKDTLETLVINSTIGDSTFHKFSVLKSVKIGKDVQVVGTSAFHTCPELESVEFEEGSVCKYIYSMAFGNCAKLLELDLSNTQVETINGIISAWDGTLASGVKTLTLPATAKTIAERAFYGNKVLTNLVLPEGSQLNEINRIAFQGASSIKNINFENATSLTKLYHGAFASCVSLTTLDLSKTKLNIFDGTSFFRGCTGLTEIKFPATMKTIPSDMFGYCSSLETVAITNPIQSIYATAFQNCTNLKNITFPTSLTSIGNNAFQNCTALEILDLSNTSMTEVWLTNTSIRKLKFPSTTTSINVRNQTTLEEVDFSLYSATTISNNAFSGCTNLTTINFGSSQLSVSPGNYTFADCTKLSSIPVNLLQQTIGSYAFTNCLGLTAVNLATVEAVNKSAFEGCTNLASVTLDGEEITLSTISADAFKGCTSLVSVDINSPHLTSLSSTAFDGCQGIKTLNLGNTNLTSLVAFTNTAIESLEIPATLTTITNFAGTAESPKTTLKSLTVHGDAYLPNFPANSFKYNTALETVIFVGDFTSIGASAFEGCSSITEVEIVTLMIGDNAFAGCSSLQSLRVEDHNELGITICKYAFSNCTSLEDVIIGNSEMRSFTSIGEYAFNNCTALKNPLLYAGLNNLINNNIHKTAFANCTFKSLDLSNMNVTTVEKFTSFALEDLTLPDTVTSINFDGDTNIKRVTINVSAGDLIISISDYAFRNCTNLESFVSEVSVSYVGIAAFSSCPKLTTFSAVFYPSISTIKHAAFRDSTGLETFNASGIDAIEANAFQGCSGLKSVTGIDYLFSLGSEAFINCTSLVSVEVADKHFSIITSIENATFAGCTSLSTYELHELYDVSVAIGNSAFARTTSLKSIDLTNVSDVGVSAFTNSGIESLHISSNLLNIRQYAFADCAQLKTLTFDEGCQVIWNYAFEGCTTLGANGIIFPKSLNRLRYASFQGCSSLKSISFADEHTSLTDIDNYAFADCTSLESVSLPEGLKRMRHFVFMNTSFTSITIPYTVIRLGSSLFYNNDKLETITFDDTREGWLFISDDYNIDNSIPKILDFSSSISSEHILENLTSAENYNDATVNNIYKYYTWSKTDSYDFIEYDSALDRYTYYDEATGVTYYYDSNGDPIAV